MKTLRDILFGIGVVLAIILLGFYCVIPGMATLLLWLFK